MDLGIQVGLVPPEPRMAVLLDDNMEVARVDIGLLVGELGEGDHRTVRHARLDLHVNLGGALGYALARAGLAEVLENFSPPLALATGRVHLLDKAWRQLLDDGLGP